MSFRDLREYLAELEQLGELARIRKQVDPQYEVKWGKSHIPGTRTYKESPSSFKQLKPGRRSTRRRAKAE